MKTVVKKIEVKSELKEFEGTLQEINDRLDNFTTADINFMKDVVALKGVENEMDISLTDFQEKVKQALTSFSDKKSQLNDAINKAKSKSLVFAEQTMTYKEHFKKSVNEETGEVTKTKVTKAVTQLPSGITYIKGRLSFTYNEEQIPEQYYKKTLMKAAVKKAVDEDKLALSVMIAKKGKSSIQFDRIKIGDEIYKLENQG